MNAPLVSCPFPVITFGWVCCCIHPKMMTGNGKLTRGAFIINHFLKKSTLYRVIAFCLQLAWIIIARSRQKPIFSGDQVGNFHRKIKEFRIIPKSINGIHSTCTYSYFLCFDLIWSYPNSYFPPLAGMFYISKMSKF